MALIEGEYIHPKRDILQLYRKHKSEFNFHLRSDDDFLVFLLNTASKVLSIGKRTNTSVTILANNNNKY